jgi:cytochrome c5
MPPQAGGDFEDTEVARAVAYMANAAGAKFAEPQRAAVVAAAGASTPAGTAAAPGATVPVVSTPAATTPAAPAAQTVAAAAGAGVALYKEACSVCHVAGVAHAPKFGDKAAWAPRLKAGLPALVGSVLNGKGAMPPKGGTTASEAEIRAAVEYMANAAK